MTQLSTSGPGATPIVVFPEYASTLWTSHTCLLRNECMNNDRRAGPGEHTPEAPNALNTLPAPGERRAPRAGALRVATGPVQSFAKNKGLSRLTAASRAKGTRPTGLWRVCLPPNTCSPTKLRSCRFAFRLVQKVLMKQKYSEWVVLIQEENTG